MSKIVVVDDDREMGRLLKTLLELEDHQVTVVRVYDKILPALHEDQPDLVLMDVRVQDQETISLVAQLRQEERWACVPVVMTSGLDRQSECMRAGADHFFIKPFLPNDLVEKIGKLLEESK